nr:MAG TPA: GIY-YIG nuclease superfamily protein [Caudoviricetes sp.]
MTHFIVLVIEKGSKTHIITITMDNVTLKNNAAPSHIGIIYIYTSPSGKVYIG